MRDYVLEWADRQNYTTALLWGLAIGAGLSALAGFVAILITHTLK